VQATNEWTLLGENDTIAAGMHVRLDLEKGERWVKLPDNTDDDDNDDKLHSISLTQMLADGSQIMTATETHDSVDKGDDASFSLVAAATTAKTTSSTNKDMDFEMMHRTLSNLPYDEQTNIQLPAYVSKSDAKHRPNFEQQMIQIWLQRQEQLRLLEQMDLPQLLKERIQQIQTYFDTDATLRLERIDLKRKHDIGELDPQDICSVLYDLEYHLTDIDMTRDFHTLGGWPLLVSLLDPQLHLINRTKMEILDTETVFQKIDRVQMHAAWCIGSAVKNQEEFHGWATQRLVILHTQQQTTTALDMLTEQIASFNDLSYDFSVTQKLNKLIYALGALLRNNRDAQAHFVAAQGATQLSHLFQRALQANTRASYQIAHRLLALEDDILTDTRLHQSVSQQIDQAVAAAFVSDEWCEAVLQALSIPTMRSETSVKAVRTMIPRCASWSPESVVDVLREVMESWQEEEADTDPDVHNDRIFLLKKVTEEARAVTR
jgi:nucleotide exchange factor SIL1